MKKGNASRAVLASLYLLAHPLTASQEALAKQPCYQGSCGAAVGGTWSRGFKSAAEVNDRAIDADIVFFNLFDGTGLTHKYYRGAYLPHNWHFLAYSRAMLGQCRAAIEAASKILTPTNVAVEQWRAVSLWFVLACCGERTKLAKALPPQPPGAVYLKAMWYFFGGLADITQERAESAARKLRELSNASLEKELKTLDEQTPHRAYNIQSHRQWAIAREVLAAALSQSPEEANLHRCQANEIERKLDYKEPPAWLIPVDEILKQVPVPTDEPCFTSPG